MLSSPPKLAGLYCPAAVNKPCDFSYLSFLVQLFLGLSTRELPADYLEVNRSALHSLFVFFPVHTGSSKWLGHQALAALHSSMVAFVQFSLAVRFSALENVACL